MIKPLPEKVDVLILGAGWTSSFLIPLLKKEGIQYAATTTDGRGDTIPFRYDPDSNDETPFKKLPTATTVVITFPLKGKGPSAHLTSFYKATHVHENSASSPQFIQLGSTGIWTSPTWQDSSSPYDTTNPRAIAEDELLSVASGAVLNLAGLYGGARQPRNWVDRVVKSKDDLRKKGALHVIHGDDVARAIVALHGNFTPAKRWLLSDLHVYDWWDLVEDWAIQTLRAPSDEGGETGQVDVNAVKKQTTLLDWVGELLVEEDVKALPRDTERLGRVLDGREFWRQMGIWPIQGRIR